MSSETQSLEGAGTDKGQNGVAEQMEEIIQDNQAVVAAVSGGTNASPRLIHTMQPVSHLQSGVAVNTDGTARVIQFYELSEQRRIRFIPPPQEQTTFSKPAAVADLPFVKASSPSVDADEQPSSRSITTAIFVNVTTTVQSDIYYNDYYIVWYNIV